MFSEMQTQSIPYPVAPTVNVWRYRVEGAPVSERVCIEWKRKRKRKVSPISLTELLPNLRSYRDSVKRSTERERWEREEKAGACVQVGWGYQDPWEEFPTILDITSFSPGCR